jgi:hypothetical protein
MPTTGTNNSTKDENNKVRKGVVDLVLFDGASNVQKAGRILAIHHPRITVVHGAEHVTSLFFKDVYTNVSPAECNSSPTNRAAVSILFLSVPIVQSIVRFWKTVTKHFWIMQACSDGYA